MAKKHAQQQKAPAAAATPAPPVVRAPAADLGVVIALVVDSVSAKGVRCPAGTVISPHVEGWPEHRVAAHLRHGFAARVAGDGD